MRRFYFGIGLILLLAYPAIVHSHAAIEGLLNKPPSWVPDSLPEKAAFNDFSRRFSASDIVMLSWPSAKLDSASLAVATLAMQPLCSQRYDPQTDADRIDQLPESTQDWIRQIREACETPTPFHWARSGTETLERMMASPARLPRQTAITRLRGSLVGPDGEQTCLVVSLGDEGDVHRRRLFVLLREMIADVARADPEKVAIVGSPFDGATVDDESVRSIQTFTPPSAVFAALLCFLCLRSLALTGVITAIAVLGEGLVMAAVYYTGTPMNAVLIVLPPLVFVLTVSAGIHLSNYYLDATEEFSDLTPAGAARRALRAGTIPCLLATGTTVIGLGSLMLVRLEPIRVFGFVSALGVMTTLSMLLLMLPGAMVLTKPRRHSSDPAATDEVSPMRRMLRTKMRARLARPWPLIIGFLLVTSFLASGLFQLETSISVPRMFQPDSPIRTQYAWFQEHIGPTVTGDLLLKFAPSGEDDDPLERLEVVKDAHLRAHKMESIDGVLSAMSFVPAIPRRRTLSASATRGAIRKLIRDPESSIGELNFISRDDDAEVWRISMRMVPDGTTDFAEKIALIRTEIEDELADSPLPVEITLTGHVAIVQKAQQVLLRDLFRSFMAAFGVVAIVMMFLLRSLVGGLLAMIPNLFPTVTLFGIMGLIRAPLDIGSVMTASVALGIAVDDTIHLLSRFGSRRARGFGQIRAAFGALGQCGWAMFQTTTVCGLSLMVYWFSDFVPASRFALLMFGLLSAALLGDVFLLPGMMASPLGRWLAHTVGSDPDASLSADEPEKRSPRDVRRLPTRWSRWRRNRIKKQKDKTHSL
ncbi:MAG: MMPL family transporter [Pirellulaceae bacterium]|nr:MMPL family transporter [Pirellulaceae bacterium]